MSRQNYEEGKHGREAYVDTIKLAARSDHHSKFRLGNAGTTDDVIDPSRLWARPGGKSGTVTNRMDLAQAGSTPTTFVTRTSLAG